jgi:transcriptional antiterminator RfaH
MAWYALRSKPNKEEAVWRELHARGFEAFYPRIRVKPVNPRARKVKPYFPGYLFVQANLHSVGQAVFSWLPFAQGLVSFDGEPAAVPAELLGAIRLHVDEMNASSSQGFETRRGYADSLKEGDKVVISDGPFAGYQAIFNAHLAGVDRVCVLLQLLQARPMKLSLPAAQIQQSNRR